MALDAEPKVTVLGPGESRMFDSKGNLIPLKPGKMRKGSSRKKAWPMPSFGITSDEELWVVRES